MTNKNKEVRKFVNSVIRNADSRREVVKRSHLYFFCTYFSKYITYEMAPLHHQMFKITQDSKNPLEVLTAFRGSGKSTIMTLSYVLWSILGSPQKKYVVIVSQTAEQAKQHFATLKRELETNGLLKKDLGPFQEDFTWNTGALIIPKYNAKIIAVSTEQSIRGTRFNEHRPDLIVCDDLDDTASVKTRESRDKTYSWFNSEIIPVGSKSTKIVVVGNLLHEDSLIKRLEADIVAGERTGTYYEFPLVNDDDEIQWPGKYPTMDDIEIERKRVGNKFAWYREYLLQIIDDREPVIEKKWVQYYQEIPTLLRNQGSAYAGGVDLAVSENKKADYTAIVTCRIIGSGDKMKIYILPNPINSRMKLPVTLDNICNLVKSFGEKESHRFYIEEVGTQRGLTQLLEARDIKAFGVKVGGNDKRTRLSMVSEYIRSGKVLFPESGADDLLKQMLNFGVEKHDDLVDALTTLLQGLIEEPPSTYNITREDVVQMSRALRRMMYGPEDSSGGSVGMGSGSGWSIEFGPDGLPHRRY